MGYYGIIAHKPKNKKKNEKKRKIIIRIENLAVISNRWQLKRKKKNILDTVNDGQSEADHIKKSLNNFLIFGFYKL